MNKGRWGPRIGPKGIFLDYAQPYRPPKRLWCEGEGVYGGLFGIIHPLVDGVGNQVAGSWEWEWRGDSMIVGNVIHWRFSVEPNMTRPGTTQRWEFTDNIGGSLLLAWDQGDSHPQMEFGIQGAPPGGWTIVAMVAPFGPFEPAARVGSWHEFPHG